MVLQSSNFARRADAENTPPTPKLANSKSKIRAGIQGASRRRRVRSAGGPHHPRYAVGHAKHKTVKQQPSQIGIELPRSSPDVDIRDTSAISMSTVSLPRYLGRPCFCPVAKETIMSVAPELVHTEMNYIREALESFGPHMLHVLAGVKTEPNSNVLPKEIPVVVNDLSSDMPTHMLGVYARHLPPSTKRRVTLFPIHNIILATHCSNLPILPTSDVARPETPGSTISLPVVPLCLPAPDVFPQLSTFLYTKRIDHLLASLLPCPVPHQLYNDDPTTESSLALLRQFTQRLAVNHTAQALLKHAMSVNGMWRNACALGIDDSKLWCALDVAWEVLLSALAVSTGKQGV